MVQVKLNLTTSTRKPELTNIIRNGGTEVEPRYEVRFTSGTFDPSDSEIIAIYAGNLKYRLIPENSSNFVSSHPPVDQLQRAPQNKIRIAWTLKPFKVDRWYQVMFRLLLKACAFRFRATGSEFWNSGAASLSGAVTDL